MRQVLLVVIGLLVVILGESIFGVLAPWPTGRAGGTVFKMHKVSAFRASDSSRSMGLLTGQRTVCSRQGDPNVRAYPKLVSADAFYGSATFDRAYGWGGSGKTFHYVLDESRGTGTGHDRLYFDADRDLDLTNDGVLTALDKPPARNFPSWSVKYGVYFNDIWVDMDYGRELGIRPFRVLPWFLHTEKGYAALFFVATEAWKGRIRIAGRPYEALLAQPRLISGRFDRPFTTLFLTPPGSSERYVGFFGKDRLGWLRYVGGRHYCISASPEGDTLTIRPYRGDYGVFEIGAGGRDITKLGANGMLVSETHGAALGKPEDGRHRRARRSLVPTGDYLPTLMSIEYGQLQAHLWHNYHADGEYWGGLGLPGVYGIKIRKDRPYVLDFSNEPEVMFASPARNTQLRLGEELNVKAILFDPVVNIMICNLTYFRGNRHLEPTATITDSDGKRVAGGTMPFG